MLNITLKTTDTATRSLEALRLGLAGSGRKQLMGILGKTGEVVLRKHFAQRESEPNKRGWPKQHFWSRIRRVTAYDPSRTTEESATVVVSEPAFGMKVHGGTIRPKTAKALAIPLQALAYGDQPKSGRIPGLKLIVLRGQAYLGTDGDATLSKSQGNIKRVKNSKLRLYYILKKSVTQKPDARALPDQMVLAAALTGAAEGYVRRLAEKQDFIH
jgi:hypothetical protein